MMLQLQNEPTCEQVFVRLDVPDSGGTFLNTQAKTTKKIVLRLACASCKAVHMHPIKRCVRPLQLSAVNCPVPRDRAMSC